jgi:MYXO-CTERM domain-containing protein
VLIYSGIGQSFEVKWDQPITALWYSVSAPTGGVAFMSGETFLGNVADGQLGVISTIPFDRLLISGPQSSYYGFLFNLEWGVVPSPGALGMLALGALYPGRRRRRGKDSQTQLQMGDLPAGGAWDGWKRHP